MTRRFVAAVLLLLVLLHTAFAYAQQAQRPPHGSPARVVYDRAIEASKQGDWRAALARYSESNALLPTPAALEGMATSFNNLGQLGPAYDAYVEMAVKYPGFMSNEAKAKMQTLAATTGMLALDIKGSGGAVTLDDTSVGTAPLSLTVRVGIGDHVVRATVPGQPPSEVVAKVTANVTVVAHIDLTRANLVAAPTNPLPNNTTPTPTPTPTPKDAVEVEEPPPEQDPWAAPHGSHKYTGLKAVKAPTIDGVLDDEIWKTAPKDAHFYSTRSKPYGKATSEPTMVQIAYDEAAIYVAFTCRYSSKRERDDTFPADELELIVESEAVGIFIDGQHDHTNAYAFFVSRAGARADVEFTQSGQVPNFDWRGMWQVSTHVTVDDWTAEYRIPWSTAGVSSHDGPFDVGIQMRRRESIKGEYSLWSLHPPATPFIDTNYFGHLSLLPPIRARETLFIQPYAAFAFDQNQSRSGFASRLYDFAGTGNYNVDPSKGTPGVRFYAGLQLRYRPQRNVQVDAAFNPDFTSVTPDTAVANLDRFELLFRENRPFFVDDRARFEMGTTPCGDEDRCAEGAQLFYSRRVGLSTGLNGVTGFAPIIYGTRVVARSVVDVAAMNVGLSSPNPDITMADNITVIRLNKSFEQGRRVGSILLLRKGDRPDYGATGVDGAYTFFNQHLAISGFAAESFTQGKGTGLTGHAQVGWTSQDYFAKASYLDIGTDFDGQLGFFPLRGARTTLFSAGYTPFLDNDLVRQVGLVGSYNRTQTQDGVPIYERGVFTASATMTNDAYVQVRLNPAIENVDSAFELLPGAVDPATSCPLLVMPGRYPMTTGEIAAFTAPRRKLVLGLGYLEGDLFNGYRREPWVSLGFNLGRFTGWGYYRATAISYAGLNFFGHQVSARATYSYSALARTSLAVEVNTLTARATVQLITSLGFGKLSAISLILRETSGIDENFACGDPNRGTDWLSFPRFVAILSFAYGMTAF